MKKILLYALATLSFITSTVPDNDSINVPEQRIHQAVQVFIATHAEKLNPEELQFLGNIIYFSYELTTIDTHVRDTANDLLHRAWATRNNTLNWTDNANNFQELLADLQNLHAATVRRDSIFKTWQIGTGLTCLLKDGSPLAYAIEAFRNHTAQEVAQWASNDQTDFNSTLAQSGTTLQEVAQLLCTVGTTYSQLEKNSSRFTHNSAVEKVIIASQASSQVQEQCQKAFDAATMLADAEINLQVVSTEVFQVYYQAVYALLSQLDPIYRTVLFDQNGIIPAQERNKLLPMPNL